MHRKFDNKAIEKKWQENWKKSGIYNVGERDKNKEKKYVLVELPYPSGNLHIGHWYAFAVPDIYVRYLRMNGKQVIYPIGFDAFGLPAENAAIKRDINPREWTESNIEYMKEQIGSMGAAFSWDKTASTIDPNYYRWTQWMFTEFYKNDIAYRGSGIVNWCPSCNTVIANEQVLPDGTCERCGATIEKKDMPQWKLKITDYADRLLEDLEALDWPEHIKESQRRWIGRSEGAEITFRLSTDDEVTVFTTRPDTLFGATYMVLAPEHSLIEQNKEKIDNWDEVTSYIQKSSQKEEQDRLDETKEKTGVKLEGITATNPANNEKIPVYISDYVLATYGTGAIMAVPAHDERDFAFAKKFGINISYVVKSKNTSTKKAGEGNSEIKDPIFTGSGELISSGEFSGMDSEDAKTAIVKKVGGNMTNTYRLRDWSIGRQRYWGVPIPIVYDPEGKAHPIPEEHLPWLLPEDVDFRPTGEPPLAKSKELKKRTEDIFGTGWTPEVETLDTFVDSSWYFLRYIDPENSENFCSKEMQEAWMPIDIYFGGAEHTTMHLLYSRFWQKVLYDLGYLSHIEPYQARINRSLILGPDGNKMSKSKGNVIDPDEQVALVGADTVKMYLAFMGPYGETSNYPWDMGGIAGLRRFLERVYGLSEHITAQEPESMTKALHKTISKVSLDIPEYKFNTAISALMIYVNAAEKEGLTKDSFTTFLKLLAPFAAHISEELWEALGYTDSIHTQLWPVADSELVKDTEVAIGVQINGKLRGDIVISPEASEEEALAAVQLNESLSVKLEGKKTKKVVYVPGRILNLIVETD